MGTVGTAVLRQYPWVLQGTVGTVDTVGAVTVGYCEYCRWVMQGTAYNLQLH